MADRPLKMIGAVATGVLLVAACGNAPAVTDSRGTNQPQAPAITVAPAPSIEFDGGVGGGWARLPSPPLAPRRSAYAFSIGGKVIVTGGTDSEPCPPNVSCDLPDHPLADGASYDPQADAWTPIAEAPVPLGLGASSVNGSTAYLWLWGDPPAIDFATASFVSYDAGADQWEILPRPPRVPASSFLLASVPGGTVAYAPTHENGGPDFWYDAQGRTWRELPQDPLLPSFDRTMVWAGRELILLGPELVPQPNSEEPALVRAAALDPVSWTWRRLPDSPLLAGDSEWYVVDDLLINPSADTSDGGETNGWGRDIAVGGTLDPARGHWAPLPQVPVECDCYTRMATGGERFLLDRQGWVLDASTSTWHPMPKPNDAVDEGQSAAWVGDRLFIFGGNTYASSRPAEQAAGAGALVNDAWMWSPAGP